jgi:YHS domain-containing protein
MRISLLLSFLFIGLQVMAQKSNINIQSGYAIKGYDAVSYFSGSPKEGSSKHVTVHHGAKFKFASAENMQKFKANPSKYVPAYGGYCAYAMANGKKVSINPKTYELKNGKLYLFYNSLGTNTLEKWKKESPEALRKKADIQWKNISAK